MTMVFRVRDKKLLDRLAPEVQDLLAERWGDGVLVDGEDEETRRIRRDVIVLALHANPDGHALVADWYMRNEDPEDRSTSWLPRLYEKYAGHDNNRDFYMANLAETQNMNRVAYTEWFPQIMYNHHQTGPAGTVMFAPPFRDPANYNFHPLPTVAGLYPRWEASGRSTPVIAGIRSDQREVLVTHLLDAEPDYRAVLPSPSYAPLLLALGASVAFLGAVYAEWYVPLGLLLSFAALVYWHWPRPAQPTPWKEARES